MKITVTKVYEIEIYDDEIRREKKRYEENPEYYYNLSDELEFMDYLDAYYDFYESDDTIIDKNQFAKIAEKWNQM